MKFIYNFLILSGNAMAACADFGVGILIIAVISIIFEINLPLPFLLLGGFFALLPDLDLFPAIITGKSANFNHHETYFHRPFLFLTFATLLAFHLGNTFWATVVFVSVFWHYLHDTKWFGGDGGIAWFWPFSKRYWSLFGSQIPSQGIPHHEWLRKYWLKPTKLSVAEVTLGLIALILGLFIITDSFVLGMYIASIILFGIVCVWILSWRFKMDTALPT